MWTVIKAFFSGASTYFYIAAAVVLVASTAYVTHRFDDDRYQKLVVKIERANLAAVTMAKEAQAKQDAINLNAAVAEAQAQAKITADALTKQEIDAYVKDNPHNCITFGIVRVLNNAFGHGDPRLPAATGQPLDACAPVRADTVVGVIYRNGLVAQRNAEQLNKLEADVLNLREAAPKASH